MRRSLVSSIVAAAGLSACVNGPLDPVELIANDVVIDAEHPELSRMPDGSVAQRYIVVLRNDLFLEGYAPGIVSQLVVENDIRVERVYQHALGGFAATLTKDQRATLETRLDVAFVVPDMPVSLVDNGGGNDPGTQGRPGTSTPPATDWGATDVVGASWATSGGGATVVVSVLDTGMDSNHVSLPAAAGCLGDFTDEATGICEDKQGHGTHVTGTIAAIDTTTPAGNRIRGLAPNATLLPGRVLNTAGSGSYAGIAAGIDAARAAGSDVINMSLGGPVNGSLEATDPLCIAITNAANAGTLTVVAAGNEGRDASSSSPARCDDALTVGAYDVNGKLASFTNYGADVDVNAPGVDIASTTFDGAYGYKSGTSMASPHAAAVAALYLQDNPTATVAQARAGIVANSASRGAPLKYNNKIISSAPKLDGRAY